MISPVHDTTRRVRAGPPAASQYPSGFSACGVPLFRDGIDPAAVPQEEPAPTTRPIVVPWRRLALIATAVAAVLLGAYLSRFLH